MKKTREYIIKFIPPSLLFKAVNLKNYFWGGYKKIHYSQFGEDIVLQKIFQTKKDGFYVDVGAHHPKRYSNTYLLYKKGWQGLNIDPNPESIRMFNRVRPRDISVSLGVAGKKDEMTYYSFSDPALNTFSKEAAERWLEKKWVKLLSKEKVNVLPLGEILEKYLPSEQQVDFLSVDVEGLDLEVLRSSNWQKFQPKVIVVEDHSFSLENPEQNPIYCFLKEKNYRLYSVLGPSLFFLR